MSRMFKQLMIGFFCGISGCATVISHEPAPADWPALTRSTHYVGIFELQRQCYSSIPLIWKLLGGFAMQCVQIDFAARTCTKYRPENTTDGDDHEEDHCDGRDHVGESTLRDAWAMYKASR